MALLARHNAAGEAAAHVSGDELDMKLSDWLESYENPTRNLTMEDSISRSAFQDLSDVDSEELVFLLTQIVEKWRASTAINDACSTMTRSTMVQSLVYAARFSTNDQLVQAGAILPIVHTLQYFGVHPAVALPRGAHLLLSKHFGPLAVLTEVLAKMLATCTDGLSPINEVLLRDGVELLGRAIFSLEGSLDDLEHEILVKGVLQALGKITSHKALRDRAAPTCMKILSWLFPKLEATAAEQQRYGMHFVADQRNYAMQILGNIKQAPTQI